MIAADDAGKCALDFLEAGRQVHLDSSVRERYQRNAVAEIEPIEHIGRPLNRGALVARRMCS